MKLSSQKQNTSLHYLFTGDPIHGFKIMPDPCFSTVYNFGPRHTGFPRNTVSPDPFTLPRPLPRLVRIPDPEISFSMSPPATPPIMGASAAAMRGRKPPR